MKDENKILELARLKRCHPDWRDGDDNNKIQTPDLINDTFKIAIEIKNDTQTDLAVTGRIKTLDFKKISSRFKSYTKEAEHKFRGIPTKYRTILLIKTQLLLEMVEQIYPGILEVSENGRQRRINKNFRFETNNIGYYLFQSSIPKMVDEFGYFRNPKTSRPLLNEGDFKKILCHIRIRALFS